MIKVNLLPQELAGRKRKEKIGAPKPSIIVVLVVGALFVLVALEALLVYRATASSTNELKQTVSERDAIQKKIEALETQYKTLKEIKAMVANQIEILNSLSPPDRLLWSEKLYMLADLIPSNVYITDLRMTENIESVETLESQQHRMDWEKAGKKGTAPPVVKKPIIKQSLQITGITYAENSEKRLQLVLDFLNALQNHSYRTASGEVRRFMDNFDDLIKIVRIPTVVVQGVEVSQFTFIITSRPLSSQN
jgi:Tfp pilus assembly protein PilN